MKTLTINIPDTIDLDTKDAAMLLAARLYERGTLSLGQAAELAGYTKRTFMERLGEFGVSVFNYPSEDLARDVKNAGDYHR